MADLDDIKDGKDFRTDQPQQNIPFTLKGCGALRDPLIISPKRNHV